MFEQSDFYLRKFLFNQGKYFSSQVQPDKSLFTENKMPILTSLSVGSADK